MPEGNLHTNMDMTVSDSCCERGLEFGLKNMSVIMSRVQNHVDETLFGTNAGKRYQSQ